MHLVPLTILKYHSISMWFHHYYYYIIIILKEIIDLYLFASLKVFLNDWSGSL